MATARRRNRAAERNRRRRIKNAAARNATMEADDTPKLKNARQIVWLQQLEIRGSIDLEQYKAGDKLYRDWRASGSEPNLVPRYDRTIGLESQTIEDRAIARLRYDRAMQELRTPLSDVAVSVCLMNESPRQWALATGRKRDDGIALLRASLDVLAEWYGYRHRCSSMRAPKILVESCVSN